MLVVNAKISWGPDGSTCSYSGCLPTRHSKKDMPVTPLTLLVAHRLR